MRCNGHHCTGTAGADSVLCVVAIGRWRTAGAHKPALTTACSAHPFRIQSCCKIVGQTGRECSIYLRPVYCVLRLPMHFAVFRFLGVGLGLAFGLGVMVRIRVRLKIRG